MHVAALALILVLGAIKSEVRRSDVIPLPLQYQKGGASIEGWVFIPNGLTSDNVGLVLLTEEDLEDLRTSPNY